MERERRKVRKGEGIQQGGIKSLKRNIRDQTMRLTRGQKFRDSYTVHDTMHWEML